MSYMHNTKTYDWMHLEDGSFSCGYCQQLLRPYGLLLVKGYEGRKIHCRPLSSLLSDLPRYRPGFGVDTQDMTITPPPAPATLVSHSTASIGLDQVTFLRRDSRRRLCQPATCARSHCHVLPKCITLQPKEQLRLYRGRSHLSRDR